MKKSKRKVIAINTLEILKAGKYQNKAGQWVGVAKQQKKAETETKLYTPEALSQLIEKPLGNENEIPTTFDVNALTTLDSVRKESINHHNIVYLNFASAKNPGGGFLNGSQAQEESIARATGLYNCQLKAENYYKVNRSTSTCLYTDHIIYSSDVPIFKDEEGELLDEVICASVITAPAVNTGVVIRNEPENVEKVIPVMKRRIDMVLAICKAHGHQAVILGAWGCGVFRNDPIIIAGLFKELLDGKYKNQFKRVVFSVYSKDEKFIQPFQQLF